MMKSIQELKGVQSGKCVIFGGGTSLEKVKLKKIDTSLMRLAVNRCFLETRIDFQVYTDSFFVEWTEDHPIQDGTILIGLGSKIFERTDYYFNWNDVVEGFHTGFYALQIAELLGFEEIYLLGYDYYMKNGKLHYYDGKFGTSITRAERKMYSRVMNSDRLLKDFDRIKWKARIYNCNPESRLKKFQFRRLKDASL